MIPNNADSEYIKTLLKEIAFLKQKNLALEEELSRYKNRNSRNSSTPHFFDFYISDGMVSKIEASAANTLKPYYQKIRKAIVNRRNPVYVDETGWPLASLTFSEPTTSVEKVF